MKVKKAVIPAAGLGTRFLPATKAQPKEMLPIVDKPVIQYIIEEAVASGIEDILIITGRGKRSIEDHFDKSYELEHTLADQGKFELAGQLEQISAMVNIYYVRQKEPKGLGDAICCAKGFVGNEPFAVMLGDDLVVADKPCIKQLMEVYEELEAPIIGIREVKAAEISKYGVIATSGHLSNGVYPIQDMIEKPSLDLAPSNLAIVGRYILTPDIFTILARLAPDNGGEIQLTSALCTLLKDHPEYGYAFSGLRYDVGDKMGYIRAIIEFALRREDLARETESYLKGLVSSIELDLYR